jgi:hypothetical protein
MGGSGAWIFVNEDAFLAPNVAVVVFPAHRTVTVLPRTRVIHHPDRDDVARVVGHPVTPVPVARPRVPAPSTGRDLYGRDDDDEKRMPVEHRPLPSARDDDVDRYYGEVRKHANGDDEQKAAAEDERKEREAAKKKVLPRAALPKKPVRGPVQKH